MTINLPKISLEESESMQSACRLSQKTACIASSEACTAEESSRIGTNENSVRATDAHAPPMRFPTGSSSTNDPSISTLVRGVEIPRPTSSSQARAAEAFCWLWLTERSARPSSSGFWMCQWRMRTKRFFVFKSGFPRCAPLRPTTTSCSETIRFSLRFSACASISAARITPGRKAQLRIPTASYAKTSRKVQTSLGIQKDSYKRLRTS